MEQPATFYDAVYRRHSQDAEWMQGLSSRTLPAMEYAIGSVLDVGCGLGQCADMTADEYHGLDFSEFAIKYARENSGNVLATFEVADFMTWRNGRQYDTVILLEVLEHVNDLQALAQLAKQTAAKRIVVTVPIDMPYVSHVKDKWSFDDLAALFGDLSVKGVIGGKWLMAVHDIVPPPVSVCMIVRNEEDCLLTALESTVGLADEVVVVDTGSTDRTLDIARGFGCQVYTGADRMHKAKSRNLALSKATGQWVVILDADERITDPADLRTYIQQTDALVLFIRLAYKDGDKNTMSFSQARAWKRGTMRYKYRAHELPVPVSGDPKLAQMTGFTWEHRPPPEREAWKGQYSLDRLLLDVEENPGDTRPIYYLGRQYLYVEQYSEAVKWLKRYVAMGGSSDLADCWYTLARCYRQIDGCGADRMAALHQACAVAPNRREFWGALADEHWRHKNYRLAIGLLKATLEIPKPETGQVQHGWYGDAAQKVLANWIKHADRIRDRTGVQVDARPGRQAAD